MHSCGVNVKRCGASQMTWRTKISIIVADTNNQIRAIVRNRHENSRSLRLSGLPRRRPRRDYPAHYRSHKPIGMLDVLLVIKPELGTRRRLAHTQGKLAAHIV